MTAPPALTARRHDLDWLRIGAFALLIFYHVGMFYVSWGWHVKSGHAPVAWPEYPMQIANPWRLSLLFLISGAALRFVTDARGMAQVFGGRLVRLLIPILFGMAVVCAPQMYFEAVEKHGLSGGFWEFYQRYLALDQSLPTDTPTWTHLWYVVYLFVYSLILLPLAPLLSRAADSAVMTAVWRAGGGAMVLVAPAAALVAFRLMLGEEWPSTHDLVSDWWNHARYSFVFVLGFVIAKSDAAWSALDRLRFVALGAALLTVGTDLWIYAIRESVPDAALPLARASFQINAWMCIAAILAFGRRWLNRPSPALRYLNDAVYPYYILHQTLIIAAGFALTRTGAPLWLEGLALVLATFAGCALFYELVVRRFAPMRLLFGVRIRPR